jgi:hypothetical protein
VTTFFLKRIHWRAGVPPHPIYRNLPVEQNRRPLRYNHLSVGTSELCVDVGQRAPRDHGGCGPRAAGANVLVDGRDARGATVRLGEDAAAAI